MVKVLDTFSIVTTQTPASAQFASWKLSKNRCPEIDESLFHLFSFRNSSNLRLM